METTRAMGFIVSSIVLFSILISQSQAGTGDKLDAVGKIQFNTVTTIPSQPGSSGGGVGSAGYIPEPIFKVIPETVSIETIPGDEDTATVLVENLINDSVTILVHFIGDEYNLLANPVTLWPGGNHTYFFTMGAPPKIGSLDRKIVVFSGTSFGGEEGKVFVTFAIRAVEGKRNHMPCDRDEECLSGLCSAFINNTKRCHSPLDKADQPADITGLEPKESLSEQSETQDEFDITWIILTIAVVVVVVLLILYYRYWSEQTVPS